MTGTLSPPRRVLILAERLRPVIGGAETVVYETARALVRRGYEVSVVYGAPESFGPAPVAEGWVEGVFTYRTKDSLQRNLSCLWNVRRLCTAVALARRIELVHVHHPLPAAGLLLSGLRHLPWVYTFHGPTYKEFLVDQGSRRFSGRPFRGALQPGFLRLYAGWLRRLQRTTLRRSRRTLVLSEYMRAEAQAVAGRLPAERFRVVSGGVDIERFSPAQERGRVRRELGWPEATPVLLTVRRLVPRMGLDRLVAAMPRILEHSPQTLLVVGGEGHLAEELEQLAANLGVAASVRFPGRVPADQLPRYFQAADLFVLPTTSLEGFGLVLAESLACGTPALGTAVGGIPEALAPVGPEFLIPDASPEAIASRVIDFLAKRFGDEDLRRRCRQVAVERYTWSRVAEELEAVYDAALGGRA
jgi:glycosyltransferase involved in cell wall biosynthesis